MIVEAEPQPQPTGTDAALPVLRTVAVTKLHHTGRGDVRRAVDGVDLELHAGRFTAVVGPSGSGKTTLLQLLGALDVPTSGEVWFEGRRLDQCSERERTEFRRSRVGFVFQQFNLLPVLTAEENVALPLVIAKLPERERRRRVGEALDVAGLASELRSRRPSELSGGEQQRTAIARALVTDPAVILADEPTGALDSESGREVVGQLERACHTLGRAVVMVTHDLALAARADEILRLRDGRIVERIDSAATRDGGPEVFVDPEQL